MTHMSITADEASDARDHNQRKASENKSRAYASAQRLRNRSARVIVLVAVVATLGLADLGVTLHFMTTTGMCEANQLARVVAAGGPWALIAFKLTSITFFSTIILVCRRRWSAEVGAWLAVVVMTAVLTAWAGYATAVDDASLIAGSCEDAWVRL